jgi:sterol desaturase/sphingolipid hydroxylase (fatty acid hydroxylase superfamily)
MIDADQLHRLYDRLWVYFVDHHLLGQPAVILLGALALMAFEVLIRDWHSTAFYRVFVRRSTTAKIDIVFQLTQFVGVAFFLEVLFTFGVSIGAAHFAKIVSGQLSWARIPLPSDNLFEIAFSFLVYFLTSHFVGYWVHRLYHTQLFWHLHRFHHSAPELNFLTFYRVHPAETFTRVLFFVTPLTFLNVPSKVILITLVVDIFLNYCEHSELPWSYGWLGRWLFVSPRAHQLHHSIDAEHAHKNFSNCPLWDHVFGTWYDGETLPSAYGITEASGAPDYRYESQPIRQFMRDTLAFYLELLAGAAKPFRKAISWMRAPSRGARARAASVAAAGSAEERLGAIAAD